MKILQVNVVYKAGSTGKLVYDIHNNLLKDNVESIVCYGRGEIIKDKQIYKLGPELLMKIQSLRSRITGYAYSGCSISTNTLINIIKKENPDVVHLQCLNGYFVNIYKIMKFLKNNNIKTVLTLHAEFMYTAGCGHAYECEKWKFGCERCPQLKTERPYSYIFDRSKKEWIKMKEAFEDFENIIICTVSDWLKSRALESPFMKDKHITTVTNGIDTENVFKPTNYSYLKNKHGLSNEKIILHVTPNFLFENKGGRYVVEIAKRLIDENVKVIIVGFNGNANDLPSNIITVNHTANQNEIAAYYSMADITLLTSKKETFSMVCAESLSCGTPIVGFKAGAPELVSIKEYSDFVEQGDIDQLELKIRKWINNRKCKSTEISEKARNIYSKDIMYNKYLSIYKGDFIL